MKTIKFGIVGIGGMGSAHAVTLFEKKVKGAELVAVCDIAKERLEWAKERFEGKVALYEDYNELLKDKEIDVVLIATPHYLHPVIGIEAFKTGHNVLSEKPEGVDVKSVREFNEAAKASGKEFCIMFNQRTNILYKTLRFCMQNKVLGEMKRMVWIINNWYRTQHYYDSGTWRASFNGEGGGVLLNQCPHNLDLWQWICGMPSKVHAFCKEAHFHNISVEDDVTIYAEYDNGATATFITSTGECPGTNRLEISGTKGKAVVENGELRLTILSEDERDINKYSEESMPTPETKEIVIPAPIDIAAHREILQNFTNHLLNGEELLSPGYEGINSLSISNAAYLSSWTGKTVSLPVDEDAFVKALNEKREHEKLQKHKASDTETNEEYQDRWNVRW